jgi:hypothetical protein
MRRRTIPALLLIALLLLAGTGCTKRRVKAAPMPAPVETRSAPAAVPPPDIEAKPATQPPPELVVPPPHPAPRPPRRANPQPTEPATEAEAESKPAAPRMAPRLSTAEEDTYKEKTWGAITTAERNLERVSGRALSASQQDIAGKVRGFLAQSREAIGVADWIRARSLAEKALVLSQELVGTL